MSVFNRKKEYKVTIGMRRSWWAPIASEPANARPIYGDVEEMGAARLGTLTYTTAAADIEGDDEILRHIEQFQNGTLVAETTLSDLEVNAKIYGHGYDSGVESSGKDDTSPYGAYGFIEPIIKSGATDPIYRASFLLRISANPANEAQNAATRQGGSINPGYNSITYTVYTCQSGEWRLRQDFETEAEAEAWILGLFNATTTWPVSVQIIGDGSATPSGTTYHNAGTNVVIAFSAAPTALYDGATDKTSSVSNKTYTIPSIAAAHKLVAVFS